MLRPDRRRPKLHVAGRAAKHRRAIDDQDQAGEGGQGDHELVAVETEPRAQAFLQGGKRRNEMGADEENETKNEARPCERPQGVTERHQRTTYADETLPGPNRPGRAFRTARASAAAAVAAPALAAAPAGAARTGAAAAGAAWPFATSLCVLPASCPRLLARLLRRSFPVPRVRRQAAPAARDRGLPASLRGRRNRDLLVVVAQVAPRCCEVGLRLHLGAGEIGLLLAGFHKLAEARLHGLLQSGALAFECLDLAGAERSAGRPRETGDIGAAIGLREGAGAKWRARPAARRRADRSASGRRRSRVRSGSRPPASRARRRARSGRPPHRHRAGLVRLVKSCRRSAAAGSPPARRRSSRSRWRRARRRG